VIASGPGRLIVCPTPLGNLEDVTLRVLRALREADIIFAEDTRVSQTLLRHYEIRTPTRSFHEAVEAKRLRELVALLGEGKTVAVITDAGMPGISDPGVELVRAARGAGAAVEVLPGPSALIGGVVLSGFEGGRFRFEGFPPRKPGARLKHVESFRMETASVVWYEAPTRVRALLEDLDRSFPERIVLVLREYTKKFEEQLVGTPAAVLAKLEDPPRGELVVVLEGAPDKQPAAAEIPAGVERALRLLLENGVRTRLAVDVLVASTGMHKNLIYDLAQRLAVSDD
jgi:16S rRNA (cytidine1402-2'-O)-methyltransferase